MSDIGDSPRVKRLAANTRASMKDFAGERRIRALGLDATDLEIFVDWLRMSDHAYWYQTGSFTQDEYEELSRLMELRASELAA